MRGKKEDFGKGGREDKFERRGSIKTYRRCKN